MEPTVIIVLIIISAGLLGGVTNFFLIYNTEIKPGEYWIILLKSITMSLCASITVPLFLQVLPNNLLDISCEMQPKNYFILAGLCVLAAYFSKRFLEDLYDRVSKIEKKTEKVSKEVENVELQNQELDNINEIANEIMKRYNPSFTDQEIKKVTNAVLNTTYSYRTVHGISEDTIKDDNKVKSILELLEKAGYVKSKINRTGNEIWKSIYHLREDFPG